MIWLVAFVVGAVHAFPDLLFASSLGAAFRGIGLWGATDEGLYLARISRVLGGGWLAGNPMIFEHRHDPWLYPPFAELVEGTIGRLLGLSVTTLDWLFTFLCPALLCWLGYRLIRQLVQARATALVGSLILSTGYYLIAKDSPLWTLRLINPTIDFPLWPVRPISPQFHFIIFILALMGVISALRRPTTRRAIIAGLGVGLTFYLSHFYWTYTVAGMATLFLWNLLRRDQVGARLVAIALAVGITVGVPYLINTVRVASHPAYQDLMVRLGPTFGRQPNVPLVHLAITLLFMGCLMTRQLPDVAARFVGALLIGGWICLNAQLVTGVTIQSMHWETYTNKIGLILALCVLTDLIARRFLPHREAPRLAVLAMTGGLVAMLVAHGIAWQWHYYQAHREEFVRLQSLAGPLTWVKRYAEPEAVILTNPLEFRRAEYVTIFTQRFAYISEPFLAYALVPQQELEERYLAALAAFGVSQDLTKAFIRQYHGGIFLGLKGVPYYGGASRQELERHFQRLEAHYPLLSQVFWPTLSRYRLDYVLVTRQEWQALPGAMRERCRVMYEDGTYLVAKVMS